MAIGTDSLIEVSMRGSILGSQIYNVFQYQVVVGVNGITAAQYGEAWWNHVKTTMRGLFPTSFSGYFQSVLVRELNNATGDYGEYAIPTAERAGTRSVGTADSPLPLVNALGMRLTVGTRATRPGQKRFFCLAENDQDYDSLTSGVVTAANSLGAVLVADMVLGAPAATCTLRGVVTRKDVNGVVTAHQDVTGWLVNPRVTSQVSRKYGRGV